VLLGALLLGIPALLVQIIRARGPDERAARAFAAAMLTWLLTGFVLYSAMARLHPRYAEGFTPAVAAAAGIGFAWALRSERRRLIVPGAAVAFALYALYLYDAHSPVFVLTALGAVASGAAYWVTDVRRRAWLLGGGLAVAALVLPLRVAAGLVRDHEYDSGFTGVIAPRAIEEISSYIARHRDGARYEFVVADPSEVGSIIVHDLQPIRSLTSYDEHELLPVPQLASLVAAGEVRFAYIGGRCVPHDTLELAPCSAGARWVRAHGIDISRKIGLAQPAVLYYLPSRYRQHRAPAHRPHAVDSRRR
jgi:hypothetical protein